MTVGRCDEGHGEVGGGQSGGKFEIINKSLT